MAPHTAEPPKIYAGKLKPYSHEELGRERGRAKDPVAYMLATEQRARERQVAYETVRLLREEVQECCRREGVNQFDNCKDVTQKLYDVVIQKDMGQLHPNWSNPTMKDGW